MIVVGLTGGIASGKTTVAEALRREGAAIIDTDEIAREVTAPGSPALDEIVEAFGRDMVSSGGTLDRRRLGSLVFCQAQARRRLEEITHPRIRAEMIRRLDELRRQPQPPAVAVVVIPLLYESGSERDVDVVVVVTAPPEEQVRRLMTRDGLSRDEAQARVSAQMPTQEKAQRADFVIDASGSIEETQSEAAKLWRRLAGSATKPLP